MPIPKRTLLGILTVVLLLGAAAASAARGWELLGERTVTDRVDHDSIAVTAAKGTFKSLQVRVKGRAVEFHSMTIHFRNGEKQ
jgi:hypothetical protein